MSTRTTGALAIAFPVDTPAHLKTSIKLCNELCQVSQINGQGELGQIVTSLLTALDAIKETGVPSLSTVGTAGTTSCSYRLVGRYPAEFPSGNANQPGGAFLGSYPWPPPTGRNVGSISPPAALAFWLGAADVTTFTVGGTFHAGDVLNVTINGTLVAYTVLSGDTNDNGAATSLAAAITTAAIPGITSATASSGVVTLVGPVATLVLAVTGASHSMTLTLGAIGGLTPHAGDVIATTVNGGSPISYTVVSGDTTFAILATHIAGAITAAGQSGITATAANNVVTVQGAVTLTFSITGSGSTTQVLGLANPYYSNPAAGIGEYALHARGLPGTRTVITTANEQLTTGNKVQIALPAAPTSAVTGFTWDAVKTDDAGNAIGAVAIGAPVSTNVFDDGHALIPYTFRPHTDVGYDATVGVIYAPRVWPQGGD